MTKLITFLKPYAHLILLAVLLLFGQAMADLALPDYMSQIVNNGIQQGGIETAVPDIVETEELSRLMLFMSPEDGQTVESAYGPAATQALEAAGLPEADPEEFRVLMAEDADLAPVMEKAVLAVSFIRSISESAGDDPVSIGEWTLPPGTDLFAVLASMPEETRSEWIAAQSARFEELGSEMTGQMAVAALGQYYTALGRDMESVQRSYILRIGFIMLGVTLLGAMASISVGFIASRTAAGVGLTLRESLFTRIESFASREFDTFSTASLITRSTNDVMQIQMLLVMMIRMIFYAPIMGIGGVIRALDKSPSMSWIIALAVAILILMILVIFRIALPKFKRVQKLVDRLNRVMRDNLAGMMVIRAFNTQFFEEARFDEANRDLTETSLFVNRVMVFLMPAMMLIMNGTTLLIIWVGAHQIADSTLQVGDMMAFMQYALQIIFSFLMLSMMFIMVPRAAVSAQRIAEVLETEPSIVDPANPVPVEAGGAGEIRFNNVGFRFPGAEEDLLGSIDFTARPGKTTAIIGATGSGKSTLVNLIPRFYDVTKGEILIDGQDIRSMRLEELRGMIGYIPQKATLFSGTIESNLRYAREEASGEELGEAVRIAQASDILSEKEEGMQAPISQGGANVSGGQKQRLSIARALVKNPKILIIDDSFSALDFKTDMLLRRALKERTQETTVLLVAQRIATIKDADQIVVLEEGRICGIGRHRDLMETCATYREIALSQLSAEELA